MRNNYGAYTRTIRYIYANNELVGFGYNNNAYYYRKNLFGDIVEVYDSENNLVASYTYDAWGNCSFGANVDNIANVNPFRYRGYYYDWETRYYYLQTRYYDAEVGRFLNADSTEYLDPETINGCNLYAYCGNNPIINTDPNGSDWQWNTFWDGLGMVITAIGAITLAVTTFGAGIPVAMAVIAGVTLGAGVLTGINGVATVIEAGTEYNFVRDGLFNDVLGVSDSVYNTYADVTEGVATVGSMILGVYHTTGQYKAAKASQRYLGRGYTKASKNRWISKDRLRQVRWDTSHHIYDGTPSKVHFNWYEYTSPITKGVRNKPINDVHVWIEWFKYHI